MNTRLTNRLLRLVLLAALVSMAPAGVVGARPFSPASGARSRPPVVILAAKVQGRVAKVRVGIRGWRPGARWRIFVDGAYNNFSTNRTIGLALNLRSGVHRLTADLVVARKHSARSSARKVRVARSGDPLVAAAGDIACDPADPDFNGGRGTPTTCHAAGTVKVIAGASPRLLLPLGDEQYECGGASAFARSYALSWGRLKRISRPILGNHEYAGGGGSFTPTCDPTPGAGYFSYFGARAGGPGGYYSYDVGSWHMVALNSECQFVGGCGAGSPQEEWLRADLAAHPASCTLAYWHRPRWTATSELAGDTSFDAFWRDLYAAGAEVVLNGHRHLYIRSTPLNPEGARDSVGLRQFVVGTGGRSLFGQPFASTVQAHEESEYGALFLTLHARSYTWQFEPEQGGVFTDYGSTTCH
jgi:hypothetical protein